LRLAALRPAICPALIAPGLLRVVSIQPRVFALVFFYVGQRHASNLTLLGAKHGHDFSS
jgi:hypothetical protein